VSSGATGNGRILLAAAAAALLLQASGGGCGGWKDEAIEAAQQRDDAAQKNRRALTQKRIDEVAAEIVKDPLDLSGNKTEIQKVSEEAQNAGVFGEFEAKLADLKATAERAYQEGAAAAAKTAIEKARAHASAGRFKEARREIEALKHRIGATDAWKSCEEALGEIAQRERAEALWARNKAKAETLREKGEPERARGVLEAFLALAEALPAFRESPRAKEAQEAVKALERDISKAREVRKTEAAIKWQPAFTGRKDDLFKWDLDRPDAVDVNAEKVCVFKYTGGDEPTTYMTFNPEGAEEWEEYIVTLKAWIADNDKKVYVIAHGELVGEEGERERKWEDTAPINPWDKTVPRGKWVDLRLEVRNGETTLFCNGVATQTNGKAWKRKKGPFQIRIEKGAEIRLKEVWVKVYRPA